MSSPVPRNAELLASASADDLRSATVDENETFTEREIADALAVGAKIVASTDARKTIVERRPEITAEFAYPAANWDPAAQDYPRTYQYLSSIEWERIRLLRLRSQNFTGNNLLIMGNGYGLHAMAPIPDGFEKHWTAEKRDGVLTHWQALRRHCPPDRLFRTPNILGEVGWWLGDILINVDVIDYQERLNLLHISGIIDRFAGRKPRILEIGGGYGALAYALFGILQPSQYVICDLPESLLFSGLYLSFARRKPARVFSEGTLDQQNEGEVCVLPNYLAQVALPEQKFDLVINTLSLSEMSEYQVRTYAKLISAAIGGNGVFFEQNHDNKHLGFIDCRDYLPEYFGSKKLAEPGSMPSTRGTAIVWSN